MSVYGYARPTTPNLERFAERAVVYERAIAASCWSLPCHASMFTGLFPARHGADDQHQFLDPIHPTLPAIVAASGYRTVALCRKRDVGPATGMDRGFDRFNPPGPLGRRSERIIRRIDNAVARVRGTRDNGFAATSRRFKSVLGQLAGADEPFFLFVSTLESHIPYRPPRRFNRFLPAGVSPAAARQVNQDRWRYMSGNVEMQPGDFDVLAALYDAGILYADHRLGEIFGWLDDARLLDDMLVIITADHGENLGEHGLMAHGYSLYDTVVHVPLIVHYPKGIIEPGRVGHQVQGVDLLPTVLDLLHIPAAVPHQGRSLLSGTPREHTFAEQARPDMATFRRRFPAADVSAHDRELRMIRSEQHKFIWSSDGRHELYDLVDDPDETRSLIGQVPGLESELAGRLQDWHAEVVGPPEVRPAAAGPG